MREKRILLVSIVALLLLFVLLGMKMLSGSGVADESYIVKAAADSGSELINGYQQWTRVNPKPVVMDSQVAALCASVVASKVKDPHSNKFITVYVNDIGKQAMLEMKVPSFPQGSIIVKQKLPSVDSATPELLTVMMKREPGYNLESGDWEYMVTDGTGQRVQARGKLEQCQACHMMDHGTDYVSRNYLPDQIRKKLK
jgi:hypothetical protein